MTRPYVKILIAVCIIVLGVVLYLVVKNTHSSKTAKQVLDTLTYTEKDYDKMRDYYNSDTTFQKVLNEDIQAGDSSAMQVKKLLNTLYHFRYNGQ